MPIKYIGRTTNFKGKTLWEILGNLKDYGKGRVVVRSVFERYPENSWFRILNVETVPNPEQQGPDHNRKVVATVEKVWRGYKYPQPVVIDSVSYKPDYRLIPRNEEVEYCKIIDKPRDPLPLETVSLPPLLKELMKQDGEQNPRLKIKIKQCRDNRAVLPQGHEAEPEGIPVNHGLGKTVSPELYENVLQ